MGIGRIYMWASQIHSGYETLTASIPLVGSSRDGRIVKEVDMAWQAFLVYGVGLIIPRELHIRQHEGIFCHLSDTVLALCVSPVLVHDGTIKSAYKYFIAHVDLILTLFTVGVRGLTTA